jgi:hypothetical protein
MLTSASEPQTPRSAVGPYEEITGLKREIGAAGNVIGLSQRAGRRKRAAAAAPPLRDMRAPAEVEELLAYQLPPLNYVLEDTAVRFRYKTQDVRQISVLRRDDDTRNLLHIPSAVLDDEDNLPEFGLLRYYFSDNARVCVISPTLDGFPIQTFADMVNDWRDRDHIDFCFIRWRWLNDLARPDPGAFARLFEPPLMERSAPQATATGAIDRLPEEDREFIAGTLMVLASGLGGVSYLSDLIGRLRLPPEWEIEPEGSGLADKARKLVEKLHARRQYGSGERKGWMLLGALIKELYKETGDQTIRRRFIAILEQYDLLPPEQIRQVRDS